MTARSTMHSPINLFLFSSLLILVSPKYMGPMLLSSSFETKLFELRSLPQGNLTFLGDSRLHQNKITLTKEYMTTNASRSAGVVLYKQPIILQDSQLKKVPSFYTMFAFYIENIYGAFGDGLAFLISPDDDLLGSPGYFGVVDSSDFSRNKFIAIEFDTRCDSIFQDPDDNHVGLDINSLSSVQVAASSSLGVDLKSGNLINTWVDYMGNEKRLEVFLSGSNLKPAAPLLKVDIDLSDYLKENMFVGFSAATEGGVQSTHIEKWEFTIMEPSPPPPPSGPESGRVFPNPSDSGDRNSHLSTIAIGLTIGVCSIPFVLFFRWFCWKKMMGMMEKSEATNNLELQTIRPSRGITCQEIQLSILVDEVARGLKIKKGLINEADLVRANTVKSSVPFCNSLPAVKPTILPLSNGFPLRTSNINSVSP